MQKAIFLTIWRAIGMDTPKGRILVHMYPPGTWKINLHMPKVIFNSYIGSISCNYRISTLLPAKP